MAVMHYHFEAIHPFTDRNGRTGRVLNSLLLIAQNLLSLPTLYLSLHIIRHKSDYYRLLLGVTPDQAWEAWIFYTLTGVQETAIWTTGKIHTVNGLLPSTTKYCWAKLPKKLTPRNWWSCFSDGLTAASGILLMPAWPSARPLPSI